MNGISGLSKAKLLPSGGPRTKPILETDNASPLPVPVYSRPMFGVSIIIVAMVAQATLRKIPSITARIQTSGPLKT